MNNKTNKINNKLVFIVLLLFVSVIVLFFTSKNNVYGAFAATVDNLQPENSQLNTNEEIRTYTVNVYNGSEGIDAFQISAGDTYSLSQYGYTINNVYTDFTGREKMNNCAYGSYYGVPNVDGSTIATYSGWMINGSLIANNGQWSDYESLVVTIDAKWEPIVFTATLHDGYSDSYVTQFFNYFDGLTIPTRTRTGYEFRGWLANDGTLYDGDTVLHLANNIDLIAQWEEIFEVRLISSVNRSYDRTWKGTMGKTFTLPSLTSGYYYVSHWGTYQVGDEYTIIGNATLYAVWKGNAYNIIYKNLTFQGQTASVLWDNHLYKPAPTEYEYGVGLDISRVSAFWKTRDPYSPQLRFLGWYTDKSFTTRATNISATATGSKTFYAKWRYDQDNPSRNGTCYVDNSDPLNQDYDQMYVGLNSNNLGSELQSIGINTLVVKFWIKIKGTGTASIYLYNGNTRIQTQTISGFSSDEYTVQECTFVVPLSEIDNLTALDIRYQASTSGWWIFSSSDNFEDVSIYYEKYYVADESDVNNPEFYWHYQFPY